MSVILSEIDEKPFRQEKSEQEFIQNILEYADIFFPKCYNYLKSELKTETDPKNIGLFLLFENLNDDELYLTIEKCGILSLIEKEKNIVYDSLKYNRIDLKNIIIGNSKYIKDYSKIFLRIFEDIILIGIQDIKQNQKRSIIYPSIQTIDILQRTKEKNDQKIKYLTNKDFLSSFNFFENYKYLKVLQKYTSKLKNNQTKILYLSEELQKKLDGHKVMDYKIIRKKIDKKFEIYDYDNFFPQNKEFSIYIKKIDNKGILIYNSTRSRAVPLFIFDIE